MMLYEAVQFQRSEHYFDYTNKLRQEGKQSPRVQRNRSSSVVQKTFNTGHQQLSRTGSFVVGQKLRESKWFKHDELKVFCAVVETGFILQRKDEEDRIEFGLAAWNIGQEKSKNQEYIKIYTLVPHKDNYKVRCLDLLSFWSEGTKVRIFNQSDRTDSPHAEEIIRDQIHFAETTKQKWHGTEHFTYWCRYGPVQINNRVRNMTDTKWGNFGVNALKRRIRRLTNGNSNSNN